jgi:hypothetical protein
MMPRPSRPTWPAGEWKLWWDAELPYDEKMPLPNMLNAGERFSAASSPRADEEVREFIDEQCNERRVGSPDLRRLAYVALWHTDQQLAHSRMIESAAACREEGLPWSALSEVVGYKSPTSFQRRWGEEVEAAIRKRREARNDHYIVYGDSELPTKSQ